MAIPPLSFSSGPSMAYGAPVSGYTGGASVNGGISYQKFDWELLAVGAAAMAALWYLNRK